MEMKKSLRALGMLVVAAAWRPDVLLADETAADKIAELRKLRESVPLIHMVATTVTRGGQGSRESKIEIWEKISDGKHRLRRVATPIGDSAASQEGPLQPSLMVKDGETAWRETTMGEKKLVVKGKAELRTEYDEMGPILKKGVPKISPAEPILHQPCVLLEVREKDKPEEIIASYWISTKTGIVMKSVIDSPGDTVTEFKVTDLNMDDSFSNQLFDYKPPGDAQVIEAKSGKKEKP